MTKKLTKKQQIEELKNKITQLEKGLQSEKDTRARYQVQVDVWTELMDLKIPSVRKGLLKPEYRHHTNPRFWELQAQEMQFKREEEEYVQKGQLAQYDYKIGMFEKEIVTLTKELTKMEK